MKYYIFLPLVLAVLASCNAKGEGSEHTEFPLSCEKYLIDTGYSVVKNKIEKERILNSIAKDRDKNAIFCVGKMKLPENKYCHLAMPDNDDLDGDYTDCEAEFLR